MVDETLWPTTKLSAKEATEKLVSLYNLHEMAVLGKTQIFFRTHQGIFILEAERQKRLPHLVGTCIHTASELSQVQSCISETHIIQ